MKCPKCKSDNIQRYEVIYEQGTSNININSNTAGAGLGFGGGLRAGLGAAKTKSLGTTQSLIAEKTRPPKGDHYFSGIIMITIIVPPLLVPTGYGWWTLIACFAIGIVPVIKIYELEEKKMQKELDEWNNTWYCNKCGNSFIVK
jgi:hypothetical protein